MNRGVSPDRSPAVTLGEVFFLFALLIGLTHLIYWSARFPSIWPWFSGLQIALYLYLPLLPILTSRRASSDFGLGLAGTPRAMGIALLTGAALFPAFGLAWWGYHHVVDRTFDPGWRFEVMPAVWYQLAYVAFPEEFFFRGYVQSRLDHVLGRRWTILGAPLGPGWLIATGLFALCHPLLMAPWTLQAWSRLDVALPGLVFGWLRARTGGLAAPVAFHAACNLYLFWLSGTRG